MLALEAWRLAFGWSRHQVVEGVQALYIDCGIWSSGAGSVVWWFGGDGAVELACGPGVGLRDHLVREEGLSAGGNRTVTTSPSPGRGTASTVASCALAMARTIDRPRPSPSRLPARPESNR